jgi:hypothetical protein
MNMEIGRQNIIVLGTTRQRMQFHFWEYINRTRYLYWVLTDPSFVVWGGLGPEELKIYLNTQNVSPLKKH